MYCHKCGAQNEDHAVFCNKCGTDLSQWSAQDMDKETRSWEIWKRPGDIIEFFGFMVLLISLFMPFLSATIFGSKSSVRMIEGDGKILLVLSIIALLLLFLQGSVVLDMLGALDSLATVALSFYEIFRIENLIKEKSYGTYDLSGLYNREAGYYLMITGAIGIVTGLLVRAIQGQKGGKSAKRNKTIEKQIKPEIPMTRCDICGKEYLQELTECPHCARNRVWKERLGILKKVLPVVIPAVVALGVIITALTIYITRYYLNADEKRMVNATIEAINELSTVDLESGEKLEYAEGLYASLSPKCIRHVENTEVLQEARLEYDKLRAQSVMSDISGIGEVTLEKEEDIKRIQNAYDALSENQKNQVTNKDVLEQANEQLEEIRTAMTEAEKVAILFAEGFMNRDSYQVKQTISEEALGDDGEEDIDEIFMLFSKDLWIQIVVESIFGGQVQYSELNYFGRQTIEQIAESIVAAILITRYEVDNIAYTDGKVSAEVKFDNV